MQTRSDLTEREKVKRFDLGQLLQLLGNAGVIVGILLLGYELNQNRESMQAQTRSDIANQLSSMVFQDLNTPGLPQALLKALAGEPLTPIEEFLLEWRSIAYWRYRENVNYQYRNGLYEDEEYLPQRASWIRFINEQDFTRRNWCNQRDQRSAEFVLEINSLIDVPCD